MFILILIVIVVAVSVLGKSFKSGGTSTNPVQTSNTKSTKTPTPTKSTTPAPKPAPIINPLTAKSWQWVSTTYSNGNVVTDASPAKFSLSFKKDGTFGTTTDCNSMGGKYSLNVNFIKFSDMMSTMMACMNTTQEGEYQKIFSEAQSYKITASEELRIDMRYGAGFAIFK